MKAFIYSKRTSKKLAQIDNVTGVEYLGEHKIQIHTDDNDCFTFNTKEVKITVFIN